MPDQDAEGTVVAGRDPRPFALEEARTEDVWLIEAGPFRPNIWDGFVVRCAWFLDEADGEMRRQLGSGPLEDGLDGVGSVREGEKVPAGVCFQIEAVQKRDDG